MKRTVIFSFVFAIITGLVAYIYLSNLENEYRNMIEPIKTVVASQRIPQGTAIQPYMVTEKYIPKEYVQPKAFKEKRDLFEYEGVAIYIALNVIEESEQILSTKISKTNQDIGISNLIPEGKKAVVVNFDMGTPNILTPGTKIDIFSILEYSDRGNEFQKSVFAVAQNILILAVGNNRIGCVGSKQEDESGDNNVLTLAVSVKEAQKIFLAAEKGTLKCVIRPVGDVKILDIQPLKLSSMVNDVKVIQQQNSAKDTKSTSQKEALEIINKYSNESKKD
ncbi:MAG: Flp pilus assembly protein CpaB [Endomicrobium sp.]|jgi:pilus assembly protein CpaB|nr:Flp pilus assembly protein CpaB [Endomicrobium sp.]